MSAPKRVVIIDDDDQVRMLLKSALRLPEFEVESFLDPRDALARLPSLSPDLIVCDVLMPALDGRTLLGAVRSTPSTQNVPFIFLSAVDVAEEIVLSLEGGADQFVSKPFNLREIVARIRATLRMVDRLTALEKAAGTLAGTLGPAGALPILRFCEDHRLTGRLTVTTPSRTLWGEFLGGEIVRTGTQPESPGEEPLDALLAVGSGTYRIEQQRLDVDALRAAESRALEAPVAPLHEEGPVAVPAGRLSRIDVRGASVEVQTEAANRPHFRTTTVVARGGQVIRKVESSWQHPLQRREDQDLARAHIDRQHDRVVAMTGGLSASPPESGAGGVDGALLAWAASVVAEDARDHLGSVMTVALLRRTHRSASPDHGALMAFRILDEGRVVFDLPGSSALAGSSVGAVAAWMTAFLAEGRAIAERVSGVKIRDATRMMEAELESAGFYAAFEPRPGPAKKGAARRGSRPR